jgi:hypothetical protein
VSDPNPVPPPVPAPVVVTTDPTPVDAFLAGVKTAMMVFIAGVIVLVTNILTALVTWAQKGTPPNVGDWKGILIALVIALVTGVVNALIRLVQVAGVPFFAKVFDKIVGVAPKYLK